MKDWNTRIKQSIFLFLLFTLSGCSTKPYVIRQTNISATSPEEIYVVSHGWHTGFIVPAQTIQSRLPELSARFFNAPFLEFGWGDKGFYQAKEITSGLTLRAIFWPTQSVVHVVAVTERPDIYFSESKVEIFCLDKSQYSLLINFIEHSFSKDGDGSIISLRNGIYGNSQFYSGEGDYYLMNTCNKWTAKGLKSAGFDIDPTFKLTAGSIMSFLSQEYQGIKKGWCDSIVIHAIQ